MIKATKKTIATILLLCVACAFACFAACNKGNPSQPEHTCSFVLEKAEEKYLKTAATCTEKAVYYKSCSCGETGTETFEFGEAKGHTFNQENTDAKHLKTAATCTEKAVYYKSCGCGENGTETFESGEVLGHNYDTPTYSWDNNKCTATRVCSNDNTHTETETATAEYVKDTEATCTIAEKGHYKATFENIAFATQETEKDSVVNGEAKGHSYTTYVNDGNTMCANGAIETATCDNGCGTTDKRIAEDYKDQYALVFDMADISGFNVDHDGYGNGDAVTLSKDTDDTYGNYLSASISDKTHDHIAISYSNEGLSTLLDDCDKVYFYVYNGNTDALGLFWNFGGTINDWAKTLPAGAWTLVEASASDFIEGSYFGILSAPNDTQYKFSMFWATKSSAEETSQAVITEISALPSAEDLTGIDSIKISAARTSYNALSNAAKRLVTNYKTLTDLESAYAANIVTVFDMQNIDGFSFNWSADGLTLSKDYDDMYGNYLKVTSEAATDDYRQITITYPKEELAEMLSGCDKVYFYVYHEYTGSDLVHYDKTLLTNFGGASAYPDTDGYTTAYKGIDLKWGEWTLVEVPVADFTSGTYFGIYNVWTASEFKFSMIWATKSAE